MLWKDAIKEEKVRVLTARRTMEDTSVNLKDAAQMPVEVAVQKNSVQHMEVVANVKWKVASRRGSLQEVACPATAFFMEEGVAAR